MPWTNWSSCNITNNLNFFLLLWIWCIFFPFLSAFWSESDPSFKIQLNAICSRKPSLFPELCSLPFSLPLSLPLTYTHTYSYTLTHTQIEIDLSLPQSHPPILITELDMKTHCFLYCQIHKQKTKIHCHKADFRILHSSTLTLPTLEKVLSGSQRSLKKLIKLGHECA